MVVIYRCQKYESVTDCKTKAGRLGPGFYFVTDPKVVLQIFDACPHYKYFVKAHVDSDKIHSVPPPALGTKAHKWPWNKKDVVKSVHPPGSMGPNAFVEICCKKREDFKVDGKCTKKKLLSKGFPAVLKKMK